MILASQSPRRIQMLEEAGFTFTIQPADIDETPQAQESPFDLVSRLAQSKAHHILARGLAAPGEVIIAADTIVACDNKNLGKPTDAEDAYTMLKLLSGKAHQVATGWCILQADKDQNCRACLEYTTYTVTNVYFKQLTDQQIYDYIATGEPLDKAGSYGIQGLGGQFVDHIEGDYANIVGLPIDQVVAYLNEHQLA